MKTLDEQLELFTEPLSQYESAPKIHTVDSNSYYPDVGLWNYERNEFVFVPLQEWVDYKLAHKGLSEEEMSRTFFTLIETKYEIIKATAVPPLAIHRNE